MLDRYCFGITSRISPEAPVPVVQSSTTEAREVFDVSGAGDTVVAWLAAGVASGLTLAAVDWVVPFGEDTPERLITALLPDVLVKGGDYEVSQIAGGSAVLANGGEVRVLSFREGHSTSAIIDAIRRV